VKKRFELKFLDGPGGGKSIHADKAPPCIWLCNFRGKRWWALSEPEQMVWVEVTYKLLGYAMRLEGPALITYGVDDE
jgi:hypothetical protein